MIHQDDKLSLADQILEHWQFQQNDEGPRVRKALLTELTAGIDKLSPARITHYVQWITTDNPAEWKPIIEGLGKRWSAEDDAGKKHQLGQSLARMLHKQEDTPALLAFLHKQWQEGPELSEGPALGAAVTALAAYESHQRKQRHIGAQYSVADAVARLVKF